MIREMIAILDFGSQYGQLIARRVREQNVYSRICPAGTSAEELARMPLKGIILSGGPASVYQPNAPRCDERIFNLGVPILGICYGMQLGCQILGAEVIPAKSREYGRGTLAIYDKNDLFATLPDETPIWASHGDQVGNLGDGFVTLASTKTCPHAAVRHREKQFFGVQFHPEVSHTPRGEIVLKNFLYDICGCTGDWKMSDFVAETVRAIRTQVGDAKVICGLSGGVDSSVTASLIHQAVGKQLVCILVDNGLLRRNEREAIVATFRDHFHMDLRVVDWSRQFLAGLAGVADPQKKRKIIGAEFIAAFKSEANRIENARFLAQGTLYPDVIESGSKDGNPAANIKLHHNVGGLPAELGFELVEPLRDLFKDEVRRVGEYLGLPEDIVWRHPFPGPGLAVRVIGEVTPERLEVLRAADEILIDEIKAAGLYRKISQALAVLVPVSTVGVMGDERSYENVVAIRAVETTDFMTADFSRIPHEVLGTISSRIINEVRGVNRVVYDISSKPPATIEWE
ncbi:MAG TPA: glutamine-hydrolyzing GMP synthase [Sedimentisphaerales bacterium]|jgi:GMP synthase (glutamine-hydrolysing)|nr:glutamine-hydrolyzing GMP synthase [Sedimentisphaerales bacterium]HNU28724.1 glutamine-hydrolyzing GMP synthase [Sedimentisphaerales bacterium]